MRDRKYSGSKRADGLGMRHIRQEYRRLQGVKRTVNGSTYSNTVSVALADGRCMVGTSVAQNYVVVRF